MGLQNQASDFSSDSILILTVITVANLVNYLRSLAFSFLKFTRLSHTDQDNIHADIFGVVGSGLSSLVLLAEQLNLNKACSYRFKGEPGSKCVVCLSGLKEGEQVRKLECRHVFHKDCFDGWLDGLNFNCPLCRAPVVVDQHVECKRQRVGRDLFNSFSLW